MRGLVNGLEELCSVRGFRTFRPPRHVGSEYRELQLFLSDIEMRPEIALDPNVKVFQSEERLYGEDKQLNHRLHPLYDSIEEVTFVNPMIIVGSNSTVLQLTF